jgi:hypothetical protein
MNPYCIASSTQLRPARLARAIAASTRWTSESALSCSPSWATPEADRDVVAAGNLGLLDRVRIFSAILRPSIALVCGAITRNSSPPERTSTSLERSTARTQSATLRSATSPTGWPKVSLTALKRSMSKDSRASGAR